MNNFNRRRFLKGLGACVALPAFDSLLPVSLRAAESIASTVDTATDEEIFALIDSQL